MKPYLQILAERQTLTQEQAEQAMHLMMRGEAAPEETAGLLMGLRSRGETLDELVGFTRVMRHYAVAVTCEDPHAIDIVGTGGDGHGTFNISTTAAFVCAGAGVTVAKHGNRSVSSLTGSADVLDKLGVQTELGKEGVEYCLREAGLAFLFAPFFHPAIRNVMPVRRALGVRTFFNILGPLCNPAGIRRQLVGAFSSSVAERMIHILARLGADHAITVHAEDGLDELSLASPSTLFAFDRTTKQQPAPYTVTPEHHGLQRVTLDALKGGKSARNAAILQGVLDGKPGPFRDVVLLNAAYALHTSDRFDNLDACFDAARKSLDSGDARKSLDRLIAASQRAPRVSS